MDLNFVHMRVRSQFGRQCLFSQRGPEILDSFPPNRRDFEAYILKDPVHTGTQVSSTFAEHVINTKRAKTMNAGMNHTEGGWPKDINYLDPEQTSRFRRKTEKEEVFNRIVGGLCRNLERTVLQNNAVNIYGKYFEEYDLGMKVEQCWTRTANEYRDQETPHRPATHISWSPDGGEIAVSHCTTVFQLAQNYISRDCYIWDIENPNVPSVIICPEIPIQLLEYNHKDPHLLAAGHSSGQISSWDARSPTNSLFMTTREFSHREPVSNLIWINSKSGTEFFTSSTDGTVKWWDTRKMDKPTETLVIDVVKPDEQNMSRALGLTALEYEPTIPTRYIMGSDMGIVIGGNRKGKLASEKILYKFNAANGPIYKIERNPTFAKNFLAISGFEARIWCEDCRESAIILTRSGRYEMLGGTWSPVKYSTFFTILSNGTLEIWDIMNTQKEPTMKVKVSPDPLRSIRPSETGHFVAAGNQGGTCFLLQLSENLTMNGKIDKPLLTSMFDREARREKILEGRIREIKLKVKTDLERAEANASSRAADPRMEGRSEDSIQPLTTIDSATDPVIEEAETEFFSLVEKERAIRAPKVEEDVQEEEVEEGGEEGEA